MSFAVRPVRRTILVAAVLSVFLQCGTAIPAIAQNARWAIWVMKADGTAPRMVAQVEGFNRHSARWSHDGKRIAFVADPAGEGASSIYVVNADGTGLARFAEHNHPDWSPDDKQIAFDTYGPAGSVVVVQNVDGQGRTEIAPGRSPRWSPDGSKLALWYQKNVYVHDLVSGESRALFKKPVEQVYDGMAWFPDGKRLAVVVRPEPRKRRQLLFVSVDGEEQGIHNRMESEMSGFLSFSPDGKQLLIDNAYKMHLLDVEGTAPPVTFKNQPGANTEAEMSADGQWIVFASSRDVK